MNFIRNLLGMKPLDYVNVKYRIGSNYPWGFKKCAVKTMPNGRLYINYISDLITILDCWGTDGDVDKHVKYAMVVTGLPALGVLVCLSLQVDLVALICQVPWLSISQCS